MIHGFLYVIVTLPMDNHHGAHVVQAQQVPLPPGEWLQREVESEEVGVNRPRKMCLGEKVVQL